MMMPINPCYYKYIVYSQLNFEQHVGQWFDLIWWIKNSKKTKQVIYANCFQCQYSLMLKNNQGWTRKVAWKIMVSSDVWWLTIRIIQCLCRVQLCPNTPKPPDSFTERLKLWHLSPLAMPIGGMTVLANHGTSAMNGKLQPMTMSRVGISGCFWFFILAPDLYKKVWNGPS